MKIDPNVEEIIGLKRMYMVKNKKKEKMMRMQKTKFRARHLSPCINLFRKGGEYPLGVQQHFDIRSEFPSGPRIDCDFKMSLYDYQQNAVDEMLKKNNRCGLMCSPTGSGKTAMISYLISHFKERTIILVKNLALLYQMKEEVEKFTTAKSIGLWGDGKKETGKDIIIVTQAGFIKDVDEFNGLYPNVIVDEADCFVGPKTLDMLIPFEARRIFGFTATPYTVDYEEDALILIFGPMTKTVYELMTPKIAVFHYENGEGYYEDYAEKRQELIEGDDKRIQEQIRIIQQTHAANVYSHIMVLYDRVEIVRIFHEAIEGSHVILGEKKKDDRDVSVDEYKEKGGVLIATESTVGRGFNVPEISCVFLLFPNKFDGRVKQMVGRALRRCEGKIQPVIVDWCDSSFRYQYKTREKTYKELWGKDIEIVHKHIK